MHHGLEGTEQGRAVQLLDPGDELWEHGLLGRVLQVLQGRLELHDSVDELLGHRRQLVVGLVEGVQLLLLGVGLVPQ
jgi:hypothetical protein